MLPKNRVLAAFENRPSDKVPIYVAGFSSCVASQVLGREAYVGGGIQRWREARALWQGKDAHAEYLERSQRDAYELSEDLNLDMVRTGYWRKPERPAEKIDEHTYLYGDRDGEWEIYRFVPEVEVYQVIDRSPRPEPSFEDLERQVNERETELESCSYTEEDFAEYHRHHARFPTRAVAGAGCGMCIPREPIWLEAIALRTDLVARLLDVQVEKVIRSMPVQGKMGLRFIQGGGDMASNKGPLYSPKAFHSLMLPRLQRISEAVHAINGFHMWASDGNLWPIADDLFGASGVDCFYEIDVRAGMHLHKLRERFPKLTLMGGINSWTLHRGTRQDVVAETRAALAVAKKTNGVIAGCSNYVLRGTSMDNFWAMMDTLYENR